MTGHVKLTKFCSKQAIMTSVRMSTPDLPTPAVQWTRVGGRAGCTADSTADLAEDARVDFGDPENEGSRKRTMN